MGRARSTCSAGPPVPSAICARLGPVAEPHHPLVVVLPEAAHQPQLLAEPAVAAAEGVVGAAGPIAVADEAVVPERLHHPATLPAADLPHPDLVDAGADDRLAREDR